MGYKAILLVFRDIFNYFFIDDKPDIFHKQHKKETNSFLTIPLPTLVVSSIFMCDIFTGVRHYFIDILICISLIISNNEHFYMFIGHLYTLFFEVSAYVFFQFLFFSFLFFWFCDHIQHYSGVFLAICSGITPWDPRD